jgi:hypothetical protein
MPSKNENVDTRPVLILVRPTRRGFIVEAAGSDDPYACKDSDDIGEAVLEILQDPEVDRVSEDASAPTHKARAREVHEDADPEPSEASDHHEDVGGPSTADDLLAGALSMLLEKGRKASSWRR